MNARPSRGWRNPVGAASRCVRGTELSPGITYWHRDCRRHFTVKTGTSCTAPRSPGSWRSPVLTARKSVSSMQLSKELGVQHNCVVHVAPIREAFALKRVAVEQLRSRWMMFKHECLHRPLALRERGGKAKAMPVPDVTRRPCRNPHAATIYTGNPSYGGVANRLHGQPQRAGIRQH